MMPRFLMSAFVVSIPIDVVRLFVLARWVHMKKVLCQYIPLYEIFAGFVRLVRRKQIAYAKARIPQTGT